MSALDRRRHDRASLNIRPSLESALESWRTLYGAWSLVMEGARMAENRERMALAQAKLEQCELEIERLEGILHPTSPG